MLAKRLSGKLNTELFDDVPVLQRKWQAAVRPGENLPRYEDVMLGSLGRLADHIVLLKSDDGVLEVSRSGRYVQEWLDDERWDIPLRLAAGLRDRVEPPKRACCRLRPFAMRASSRSIFRSFITIRAHRNCSSNRPRACNGAA
jgi:hypothetical protein